MTKVKSIFCLIITLILETFVLCLAIAISVLNQYKIKGMTSAIMGKSLSNLFFHPISTISKLISKGSPVLIIGTIVVLIYMAYVVYKSSNKGTYKIETKYAVHGSSRFANNNEIFVENEITGFTEEKIFEDLNRSTENKNGDENNEEKKEN
jgi:preprotein translocase subunit SecG